MRARAPARASPPWQTHRALAALRVCPSRALRRPAAPARVAHARDARRRARARRLEPLRNETMVFDFHIESMLELTSSHLRVDCVDSNVFSDETIGSYIFDLGSIWSRHVHLAAPRRAAPRPCPPVRARAARALARRSVGLSAREEWERVCVCQERVPARPRSLRMRVRLAQKQPRAVPPMGRAEQRHGQLGRQGQRPRQEEQRREVRPWAARLSPYCSTATPKAQRKHACTHHLNRAAHVPATRTGNRQRRRSKGCVWRRATRTRA